MEGGSIRLVTSDTANADGVLRGALEIRLAPGWKTYWRDPGDSGVPPTVDVVADGQATNVDISFPAPRRFDDGYSLWTGYDEPLSLALALKLPQAAVPTDFVANVFLGICETICIPVQAQLSLETRGDVSHPEHEAVVDAAFAALPDAATETFGAKAQDATDEHIVVDAALPEGARAVDLFVAGNEAVTLGMAEREAESESGARFTVPVLRRADGKAREDVVYTLVTTQGAVTGRLALP